jgi:hypothetical protein
MRSTRLRNSWTGLDSLFSFFSTFRNSFAKLLGAKPYTPSDRILHYQNVDWTCISFLPHFVLLSHQKTWTKSQPSKPNYSLSDATSNNNWTRNIYFLFPSSHFVTLSFFLSLLSFCQISNNLFSFSFSRPFLSTIGCPCSQGVRAKERPPTTHITYFFLSCPKLTPYHCI